MDETPRLAVPKQRQVDYAALGGLFSSTVIQELARQGRSRTLSRYVGESGLAPALRPQQTVREVFELAFGYLARCHRSEYVFKDAIANRVLVGRHTLNTAVMLSEMRVGPCKADVVILNGTSTAYEIKSDRDRLDRLPSQANTYLHSFARVVVVASDRHVRDVLRSAPPHVGVTRLTSRGYLSSEREPVEEPSRIMPAVLFDALQLQEASQVLNVLGVDVPHMPNTVRHRVYLDFFKQLDPVDLHTAMIQVLKTTRSQQQLSSLFAAVPPALRAALVSTRLRQADHERFLCALGTPMAEAAAWK